jgi:D-sedoheptulose 7-phosphate isomerase
MNGNRSAWLEDNLAEATRLTEWLATSEQTTGIIRRLGDYLADCLARGARVLTCGNGGSMCDAMHMAEELSGRFRGDRRPLAAQAISDPAHLTCVANDYGFEHVFARAVQAWGREGDVLVTFSTSGNSVNVVRAATTARACGMSVVGILGRDGGQLAGLCDWSVVVPGTTSDRIQEVHIKVVHLLVEAIKRRLVPSNYQADDSGAS